MKEQEQQERRAGSDVCGKGRGSERAGLSGLMRQEAGRRKKRAKRDEMKINRTNKKHRLGKGQRCNETTNNMRRLLKQQCIKFYGRGLGGEMSLVVGSAAWTSSPKEAAVNKHRNTSMFEI